MVNVTMDQIIAFRNAEDIFENYKLPLKVAYKLNKLKKAIEVEGEFYSNKFQEIVDTYAKKDDNGQIVFSDDGNQIMIQDGKVEECNQALEDLQALTVEIDNCNLTIDDFGDDIQCTPEDLEALMPFLN
jgi:Skp family chaperone for outer membrane proteins